MTDAQVLIVRRISYSDTALLFHLAKVSTRMRECAIDWTMLAYTDALVSFQNRPVMSLDRFCSGSG